LPEFSLSCDEQAALRQKRLHPSDFAESLSKSTKVRGPRLVAGSGMTPLKKLAADEPQASTEGVKETSAESPDNAALVKFLNRSALMEMGKKNFPEAKKLLEEALRTISSKPFLSQATCKADVAALRAATTANMGNLMLLVDHPEAAGKCFEAAYNLERKFSILSFETSLSRASWFVHSGKSKEAAEALRIAGQLAVTDAQKGAVDNLLA
jgi:tetratricopeptide (TPR) repeat protein